MVKVVKVSMEVAKEEEQEVDLEEEVVLEEDVEDQVGLVLLLHPQATPTLLLLLTVIAALVQVPLQPTDSQNNLETMDSLLTVDMVPQVEPALVMVLLVVLLLWIQDTALRDPQQEMAMEPLNTLAELAEGETPEKSTQKQNKRQFTKELYQDVFDSQAKIFLILLITMMTDPTSTTDSRQTTLVRFIVENIYYALCFSLSDISCCRNNFRFVAFGFKIK